MLKKQRTQKCKEKVQENLAEKVNNLGEKLQKFHSQLIKVNIKAKAGHPMQAISATNTSWSYSFIELTAQTTVMKSSGTYLYAIVSEEV